MDVELPARRQQSDGVGCTGDLEFGSHMKLGIIDYKPPGVENIHLLTSKLPYQIQTTSQWELTIALKNRLRGCFSRSGLQFDELSG